MVGDWRLLVGLAVLVALALVGLDRPALWGDEADTAVFARNVLAHGVPTAWDGTNVLAYNNGAELGGDLVSRKLPWIQYYLGALSLAVFGEGTFGARAIFALIGVLCLIPLRRLLAAHGARWPTAAAALILAAPQTLLFLRSARYYSLVTFLFLLLALCATTSWRSERARLGTAAVCLVLIVHTHYLAGLAALAGWVAFALLHERERWRLHLGLAVASFAVWVGWFYVLVPPVSPLSVPGLTVLREDPLAYPGFVLAGVVATVLDLDHVGQLPLIGVGALLGLAAWRRQLGGWLREPLTAFVGLNLVLVVVAGAAAVGRETEAGYGLIRYLPHLGVVVAVPLLLLAQRTARAARLGPRWALAALVLLLALNQLGVSYWARTGPQRLRVVSWYGPVYRDLFVDPRDDLGDAVRALLADPQVEHAPLLQVYPGSLNAVFVFYGHRRYRVRPEIVPGTPCATLVAERTRPEVVQRVRTAPDVLVSAVPVGSLPGRYTVQELPLTRDQPDGSRPELTRRRFGYPAHPRRLRIYRRVVDPPRPH